MLDATSIYYRVQEVLHLARAFVMRLIFGNRIGNALEVNFTSLPIFLRSAEYSDSKPMNRFHGKMISSIAHDLSRGLTVACRPRTVSTVCFPSQKELWVNSWSIWIAFQAGFGYISSSNSACFQNF
jgi:hypothetical protein